MTSLNTQDDTNEISLALVVAKAKNNVIGRDGDLPWRLREDLQHFKRVTLNKPVIMGRKTWESLPFKPLKNRPNLIVSRKHDFYAEGAHVFPSLTVAIASAKAMAASLGQNEVMIIGGGAIYDAVFDQVDALYVTEVDASPEGDTYFPEISSQDWKIVEAVDHGQDAHNDHDFIMQKLVRK
jgi:dihydrofolate reductase